MSRSADAFGAAPTKGLPRGQPEEFTGKLMKLKTLAALIVAAGWGCTAAFGAGEKYINIDPETGKPKYISTAEAQNVAGMAKDADLCSIKFKAVKVHKKGTTEDEDGFEFTCEPSKECEETNKAADDARKKLKKEIADEDAIINPKPKTAEELKKEKAAKKGKTAEELKKEETAEKAAAKKKKEEAEAKKAGLETKLKKFKPECVLKFFVGAGGNDETENGRISIERIKEKKIQYVVCTCQKLEIPE